MYTLENTEELFLVTKDFNIGGKLHLVMSKKEIQSELTKAYNNIVDIRLISLNIVKKINQKYFLPKNWEKTNKRTTTYTRWKQIAESEE